MRSVLVLIVALTIGCSGAGTAAGVAGGEGGEEQVTPTGHAGDVSKSEGGSGSVALPAAGESGDPVVVAGTGGAAGEGGTGSAGDTSVDHQGGSTGEAGSGGEGGDSEPACDPIAKEQACGALQCGSAPDGCGNQFDCGGCVAGSTCHDGECVTIGCANCDSDEVCTFVTGFGNRCYPINHAGSCDTTAAPNPNGQCADMCAGKSAACSKPYKDCGMMRDPATGEDCGICSGAATGSWSCGPG